MWISFRRSTSRPHSALAWWSARSGRRWGRGRAPGSGRGSRRVVGGVHEIVEIGDAGAGHGHQGMATWLSWTEAEVSTQETGIWPQATDENQRVQLCQVFASWAFSIMEAILVAI